METESELKEMPSTAIAEWLETVTVDRAKNYPEKYHDAIRSQTRIGWQTYICRKTGTGMGLYLQEQSTNTSTGKK